MKEYHCPPDCPDRSANPNCHSFCERYKQYQQILAEQRKAKTDFIQKKQKINKPYLSGVVKKKEW